MSYLISLLWNAFRAVFVSGGWLLWLVPEVRQRDPEIWNLLPDWIIGQPDVVFYVAGALVVILITAIRLSVLQVPRVTVTRVWTVGDELVKVVGEIRNVSLRKCTDVVCYVNVPNNQLETIGETLEGNYTIWTQNRRRRAKREQKLPPQTGFTLRNQVKILELFEMRPILGALDIVHEAGSEEITLSPWLFEFEIIGCGANVRFWVRLLESNTGAYKPLLLRDEIDFYVLGELGEQAFFD